ncbi:MAG: hypothetical protein KGJ68_09655 [Gammaproteobacteria bacterium]|nr:hypothetical protein [Gammaproteobacteria bacterium]
MTYSEETLIAYADGELDAAARAALEAAMAADPQLAQRVARHRALRARVQAAFAPVLEEPLPERLLASVRAAAAGPHAGSVVALQPRARARWSWPEWTAIAASLLAGALLGPPLLRPGAGASLVDTSGGRVVAGGALARALAGQLASSQPAGAPVAIGISFRSRAGAYCRTFSLSEAGGFAGLACHEQNAWRIETLARAEPAPAGNGYRPAASALPPAVAGTVAELIAGEPLDAAAESAARARGWMR